MKKIILLISFLLFSCEDDGITPTYGCTDIKATSASYDQYANVDDGSCEYNFTWTQDISYIFETCINCHFALEESYSSIVQSGMIDDLDIETNDMFRRINLDQEEADYMPVGEPPLSEIDKERIRIWLLEGAPE